MFANSIGKRSLSKAHKQLAPNLYAVPPDLVPLKPGQEAYGTTLLEQSVPRGPEGSPLLFVVPHGGVRGGDQVTEDDVARLTAANSAAVHEALRALRVSEVLAVDCGGDVLTGGLDFATPSVCTLRLLPPHGRRYNPLLATLWAACPWTPRG